MLLNCCRVVAGLCALIGLAAALSACTLSSTDLLVADDELATPLPASLAFFPYDEAPEGFARSKDGPELFTLEGKAYESSDKSMSARFVPLGGNAYLLAATAVEGSLYGIARLFDSGVVEVRMFFESGLEEALAAASAPASVAAAITVAEGGIEVASREALDFLIALIAEGKLPTAPLVAFVAETADAPTPASIARDGDGWKVIN